ncbi:two-component response regulator ARR14 [Vigna radiata var. radiata]|uniref:Two-component response regulator ARR14 n=1 Tax=Vigna radiata var. radiata TaxID=3916 RepID=A0A1S3UMY1_VIGRR|nr:two-component response regulator ARR14 [Vigna radiata var. radiata]XP_014507423.1 two-component response regulator ARR14 [Vigna radiata var. radiata]XP_014507424.1 two-component response regulator ARR14 [Vigna radiata var. radiata]XP_022640026.1 two-component response regulator ARR14 [Vigna radiata var. radiata]
MAGTSSSEIDIPEFPSSLNVLVIDTDSGVLEYMEKSCKEKSHKAVICFESSMAVEVLRKEEIEIHMIVMELNMPMMNGFEFLQFLDEEGFDIAFVMMSDDFTLSTMTKAFQLGAIFYFIKPFGDRLLDLWPPFLKHYYDRRHLEDDETGDGEAKADEDDETGDGEAKADDTLHKKDDTFHKKD